MPSKTPPVIWPKVYLLNLLKRAVEEGGVTVNCLSEAQARSLAAAINRIRRRTDRNHDAFITPDYHMVTASPQGSQLFVIYSRMPEGMKLPEITEAPSSSVQLLAFSSDPAERNSPVSIDGIMEEIALRAFRGESTGGAGLFEEPDGDS